MKPEDAIRPLKELSDRKKMADQCDQASASDIRLYHALDTAIEALEKQIPKKLVRGGMDRGAVMMVCPTCSKPLCSEYHLENSFYLGQCCGYCGQAVFWRGKKGER